MKTCRYFQDFLVEALYYELDQIESEKFQQHLKNCSKCALDFQNKKQTLEIMKLRDVDPPPSQFWEDFEEKLLNRLEKERSFSNNMNKGKFLKDASLLNFPKWSYQLAAAFLLVSIGFFIGKQYFAYEVKHMTTSPLQSSVSVFPTAVESDAYNYVERSKVLLMGIVNMDDDFQPSSLLDFSLQSEKAQHLVAQSNYLKDNLTLPHQRKLRSLISDLESILIQIANLEAEHDLSAIEVIKIGTEQKAIFLKINLYELKQIDSAAGKAKKLVETSNKKAI